MVGTFTLFDTCITKLGFPGGSDVKESVCNAGDLGSIPGSGRFPGDKNGMVYTQEMSALLILPGREAEPSVL